MRTSDPLSAIVQTISEDEEIRDAVRKLALDALEQANHYLTKGDRNSKMAVIRMIAPTLIKSMERKTDSDEVVEMREQVKELMEELRASSREPAATITQLPTVHTDTPR